MKYGYIESSKLEVLPELYVEVDLSDQTVDLYKDNDIILTTLCVTGKDSTPTRIGYFPIKYKTYDTYLKGPGYNSHVYYWMPFDGGIGLHDAAAVKTAVRNWSLLTAWEQLKVKRMPPGCIFSKAFLLSRV